MLLVCVGRVCSRAPEEGGYPERPSRWLEGVRNKAAGKPEGVLSRRLVPTWLVPAPPPSTPRRPGLAQPAFCLSKRRHLAVCLTRWRSSCAVGVVWAGAQGRRRAAPRNACWVEEAGVPPGAVGTSLAEEGTRGLNREEGLRLPGLPSLRSSQLVSPLALPRTLDMPLNPALGWAGLARSPAARQATVPEGVQSTPDGGPEPFTTAALPHTPPPWWATGRWRKMAWQGPLWPDPAGDADICSPASLRSLSPARWLQQHSQPQPCWDTEEHSHSKAAPLSRTKEVAP